MKLFNRLFKRWSKWQIIEENAPRVEFSYYQLTGQTVEKNVVVDIYEKTNKYTGIKKYKTIIKP